MKRWLLVFYPALIFAFGFLVSCGDRSVVDQPDASSEKVMEPEMDAREPGNPSAEELAEDEGSESEDTTELDPAFKETIDRFLANENPTEEDIYELAAAPGFADLFTSVGEPSEDTEARMMSAMQLLMETEGIDSSFLENGGGPPNGKMMMNSDDPEVVKSLLRAAMNGDADGLYGALVEAIEESAVANAIDPEADAPVKLVE